MTEGELMEVRVVKGKEGFGFVLTGRDSATQGRLFFIRGVNPDGINNDVLKAGDQVVRMDGVRIHGFTHDRVVNHLKRIPPGGIVSFDIFRDLSMKSRSGSSIRESSYSDESDDLQQTSTSEESIELLQIQDEIMPEASPFIRNSTARRTICGTLGDKTIGSPTNPRARRTPSLYVPNSAPTRRSRYLKGSLRSNKENKPASDLCCPPTRRWLFYSQEHDRADDPVLPPSPRDFDFSTTLNSSIASMSLRSRWLS
ncbi:unnamed protein product, partial [Mesorhabditis spiculigera]